MAFFNRSTLPFSFPSLVPTYRETPRNIVPCTAYPASGPWDDFHSQQPISLSHLSFSPLFLTSFPPALHVCRAICLFRCNLSSLSYKKMRPSFDPSVRRSVGRSVSQTARPLHTSWIWTKEHREQLFNPNIRQLKTQTKNKHAGRSPERIGCLNTFRFVFLNSLRILSLLSSLLV